MKISLNWIKDYVKFNEKFSIDEIVWRLTEATAEIERVIHYGVGFDTVVVGEVIKSKQHPEADKLFVAEVKVSEKKSIKVVYGQKAEIRIGDKIPTALVGTLLPGGEIKQEYIRGQLSEGMLCLDSELFEGSEAILTKFKKSVSVGTRVTDLLPIKDTVLEIDNHSITHRSDLFSHYGFARECVALGLAKWKKELKQKDYREMTGNKPMPLKPSFKDKGCSKNYFGTVITGVSTIPAPDWMRYRLQAVGIRSLNAIVDITNYIMMDVGQPNHAFDLRLLEGKTFENRLSKKGEKVTTLDGMERELEEGIIIAQSGGDIVDLAGIMGAENSEIKQDSSEIYFHSVQFNNVLIRKAMISLGHRTEGGTMHEKDIEAERAELGFIRGLELFGEIFPKAKFEYEIYHYQEENSPKTNITLSYKKMDSHLGIEIPPAKAKQYLEDLGFKVKSTESKMKVDVPTWRINSVLIREDLIEEIIRIHGYSNVPATPPTIELSPPVKNHKRHVKRTIQKFLTGLGFQEEVNFSFLSEKLLQKTDIRDFSSLIEIQNPVNEDFRFMRPNFLSYLLNNLARNQIYESKIWKTFEMGAVYRRLEKEVIEHHILTILMASPQEDSVFLKLKALTEKLSEELSIQIAFRSASHSHAHPTRSLEIIADEKIIGHVFDLHPMLMEQFKIKGSVTFTEINLDELFQVPIQNIYYKPLNRNPRALLDLSVVVNSETPYIEVKESINSVRSEYLESAELIDIYEGKNLGEGKKSFTFALSYQHPERTLEEKEIQDILDELIKNLEKNGGIVRR